MRVLKSLALPAFAALSLAAPGAALAQAPQFHIERAPTPSEPDAIALYPDSALPPSKVTERWNLMVGQIGSTRIENRAVRNVTRPTITPVLPAPGKATGAAVIVAPGGAFLSLSMDSEGYEVARWLADHGVAAFVLKYRLNETPDDDNSFLARVGEVFGAAARANATGQPAPRVEEPRAKDDALKAVSLVRAQAAKFGVDPKRVGIVGFSAGAMTALQASLAPDAAARPAFVGYIYGPMGEVPVPADAPPMFAALALDDGLFGRQGFGIVQSWQRAGRPIELHAYEHGDHGFGMGRPGTTSTLWIEQFHAWLGAEGWLKPRGGT